MNVYDRGDRVRFSAAFTDTAGAAADPTAVTAYIKPRYGAVQSFTYAGATIVRNSLGNFSVDVTVDAEGIWDYRFEGTGTVVAAGEGSVNVRDSQFY